MPMHQTDTLFHKSKAFMSFIFGGEADNHAVNTVPKETLVRITKAEDGGMGGEGIWKPATTGHSPDNENDLMKRYLAGDLTKVKTSYTFKPFNRRAQFKPFKPPPVSSPAARGRTGIRGSND